MVKKFLEFIVEAKKANKPKKPKEPREFPRGFVTLYTDAAMKDNHLTWAFWGRADVGRLVQHGTCPPEITTIGQAEAYAIAQGMHRCLNKWPGTKGFTVKTDSQDAKGILTTEKTFSKKEDPIKQAAQEVSNRLHKAFQKMVADKNLDVTVKWVKGHRTDKSMSTWLNNRVDQLTREARKNKPKN